MKTIQTEPGLKHSAREGSVFSSMDNMPTFYCELEDVSLSGKVNLWGHNYFNFSQYK